MKVKIKNAKGKITADYYSAKDVHGFRYRALKLIAETAQKSLTIFVDTNSSVKKISVADITELLEEHCEEYLMEPTLRTERKLFDFSTLFKGKKKLQKTERLIVAKIGKDRLTEKLYEGFLKYYDYGIGCDCALETAEMLKIYAEGYDDLLFNKEVLEQTFYDSRLFSRFRTDCTDRSLEDGLRKIAE